MRQSESQYIPEWVWVRCPKPIKIMECVTLFPQMETAIRGEYLAQDSSTVVFCAQQGTHRKECALWTHTCVRRPTAKFRILQSFAWLLFSSPLYDFIATAGCESFLIHVCFVCVYQIVFLLPPGELKRLSLFACIRILGAPTNKAYLLR